MKSLISKLYKWIFQEQEITIQEFHELNNPEKTRIYQNKKLKFIETANTNDYLVKGPDGFVPINKSLKTVRYQKYTITTNSGLSLSCADEHIIFNGIKDVYTKDLAIGDSIATEFGIDTITNIEITNNKEPMYDLDINSTTHHYYTNNIVSHNTTVIAAYLLWYACFKKNKYILVASKDNDAALDVMDRIRFSYEELPEWIKPGCIYFNKHELAFDNKSTIKSSATTENTGRGRSISLLMLDELAFVKREFQEGMWASLAPTLSTGGKCIISSTPNGDQELFAELWRGSECGDNNFARVHAPWDAHPDRDETFKYKMIGNIGELKWKQEYECEFVSSDELLISSLCLQSLKSKTPEIDDKKINWYYPIKSKRNYYIGVDVSEGGGNDYATIEVFDELLNQVAEYRSNTIKEAELYDMLKHIITLIGEKEGNVLWSFENNACGRVISTLYEKDENFPWDYGELVTIGSKLGMNTNVSTKEEACKDLKRLVESDNGLEINSATLIVELKNYVKKGRSYAAKKGCTDDLISATLIVTRLIKYVSTYDDNVFDALYRNGKINEALVDEFAPMPMMIL